MLKRFVDWVLIKLHLRKRLYVDPIKALLDLLPTVYACVAIVGLVRWLGPFPRGPWYKRFWSLLRFKFHRFRFVVIGY